MNQHLINIEELLATLLVQNGTLSVGDMIVSGSSYGKVKNISTSVEKKLKQATPSMAVEILGLNSAPNAGEPFKL